MAVTRIRRSLSRVVRSVSNRHRPDGRPNVLIFTTPRSGSTWLMELIASQPGFKHCNEPLDLRHPDVVRGLGIREWNDLYSRSKDQHVAQYFRDLASGRLRSLNSSPRERVHRWRTSRLVLKVLHGGEDRIASIADAIGGKVVLLLRHPIPVTLSREVLPRLMTFVESDFSHHFDDDELSFARSIIARGSKLERGVLDWTLQNVVPLRMRDPSWSVVCYEQLVLQPAPILEMLSVKLDLDDAGSLQDGLDIPSLTSNKSDAETNRLLQGDRASKSRAKGLVGRWRDRVDVAEARRAMSILDRFGLDLYAADRLLPTQEHWIGEMPTEFFESDIGDEG